MSGDSNNSDCTRLSIDIVYDGAIVGHGILRSMDAATAFVVIRDFPLDARTFLELAIHLNSGETVRVPVRLLENTGEGLQLVLEGVENPMLTELTTR